jgi:hypothetical protein
MQPPGQPPQQAGNLVPCGACGNPVSPAAPQCPRCGHPISKPNAPAPQPGAPQQQVSQQYGQPQLGYGQPPSGSGPPPGSPPSYGQPQGYPPGYGQQGYGPHPPRPGGSGGVIALAIVGGLVLLIAVGGGAVWLMGQSASSSPTGGSPAAGDPAPPTETPEERDSRQLAMNPDPLLEESDVEYHDKGIINDYRQLAAVSVLNKAHVAVRNMEGTVEWLGDDDRMVGSTPFTLKGFLPAGGTKRFTTADGTLTAGTIQGAASKARLTFTRADPVN